MAVKRAKTLKSIFSIFLIKILMGLVLSVLIPVLLCVLAIHTGSINYANSSELEAFSIAESLKSAENPQIVLNSLSRRIQYLIVDSCDEIQRTTMDEEEIERARKYLKTGIVDYDQKNRYIVVEKNEEIILLQYKIGSFFTDEQLDKLLPAPETILIAAIVVCGFISSIYQILLLERRIHKELNPIFDATKEFAKQNLDYEVMHSNIKEFEEVLRAFDNMKEELGGSLRRQWRLQQEQKEQIAALVHDFKTPMTITMGNLDLLEETALNEEQSGFLRSAFEGLDKMSRYIQLLMDITMASVKYQYCFQECLLTDLLKSIEKQTYVLCRKGNMEFINEITPTQESCLCDADMLERAVMNVIQNAAEHTPKDGRIRIKTYEEGQRFYLQIEDSGKGFSRKMLEQGSKLFAMDDESRTKGHHYGMGLYFADSVVQKHGGEMLLAHSDEMGGAKIIIKINLKKE